MMTEGLDLLTEIATDVKYIKHSLEEHIQEDKKIHSEFLRPLWETHQQQKGAAKLAGIIWACTGGIIVGCVDYFMKGSHP